MCRVFPSALVIFLVVVVAMYLSKGHFKLLPRPNFVYQVKLERVSKNKTHRNPESALQKYFSYYKPKSQGIFNMLNGLESPSTVNVQGTFKKRKLCGDVGFSKLFGMHKNFYNKPLSRGCQWRLM